MRKVPKARLAADKARISAATPNVVVNSQTDLVSALAGAPNNTAYTIGIGSNFSITSSINLPPNKNIILVSSGGTKTLLRAPGFTGALLHIDGTSGLTLEDIVIDGNKANVSQTAPMIRGVSGSMLSITDGAVLQNNQNDGDGGAVYMYAGSTLLMSGGLIIGNTATNGSGGGIINFGNFTMSGGTITGNMSYNGGGITNSDNGTFLMTGGTISDNGAYLGGGVSLLSNNQMVMDGGSITHNHSEPYSVYATNEAGGGVYVSGTSRFVMNNGTVDDNTAYQGGGVFINGGNATFVLNGGSVSHNHANLVYNPGGTFVAGGGVFVNGFLEQNGGIIEGNDAVYYGGGVYVSNGSTYTMTGGNVNSNTAPYGGGVYNYRAEYMLDNGLLSGNHANYGGGVFNGGTLTQNGGNIAGNVADTYGGAVYNQSIYSLVNGSVADNVAGSAGGGIVSVGTLTIARSVVTGNTAPQGGGMYLYNAGTATILSSELTYNTASVGGAVYVVDPVQLTIAGPDMMIARNSATSDASCDTGGAIYSAPRTNTVINQGVIFTRNYATHAYVMDLGTDQAAYNSVVHGPSLDPQYRHAWNNADINWCPGVPPRFQVTFWRNSSADDPVSMIISSDLTEGSTVRPIQPPWDNAPLYFAGWSFRRDDTCPELSDPMPYVYHSADFTPGDPPNLNVYAIWCPEPIYHTVTFDAMGGSAVPDQHILGGDYAVYGFSIRAGCILEGWYTDPEYDVRFNFDTPIYVDMTLYARWSCAGEPGSGYSEERAEEMARLEDLLEALQQGDKCYNIGILTEYGYQGVEIDGQCHLDSQLTTQSYLAIIPLTIAEVEEDIAKLEEEGNDG
jgi:hypothetical protein